MKFGVWTFFMALLMAAILSSGYLWAAEDIALDVGLLRSPPLTQVMFAYRVWLPLSVIPWLVAAIWIQKSGQIGACYAYAASCVLAIVLVAGISTFAAILPWMDLYPILRQR